MHYGGTWRGSAPGRATGEDHDRRQSRRLWPRTEANRRAADAKRHGRFRRGEPDGSARDSQRRRRLAGADARRLSPGRGRTGGGGGCHTHDFVAGRSKMVFACEWTLAWGGSESLRKRRANSLLG